MHTGLSWTNGQLVVRLHLQLSDLYNRSITQSTCNIENISSMAIRIDSRRSGVDWKWQRAVTAGCCWPYNSPLMKMLQHPTMTWCHKAHGVMAACGYCPVLWMSFNLICRGGAMTVSNLLSGHRLTDLLCLPTYCVHLGLYCVTDITGE